MDQSGDELYLVNVPEVGNPRQITRFDQRSEAILHEVDHAAAEHILLTEEILIDLVWGSVLSLCNYKDDLFCLTTRILLNGDETRHIEFSNEAPVLLRYKAFWSDHDDIGILWGLDFIEDAGKNVEERKTSSPDTIGTIFFSYTSPVISASSRVWMIPLVASVAERNSPR